MISLFVLVVEFVVRCRCLCLLLGLLGGAGVSAVGRILLPSPGWVAGAGRNVTPGKLETTP